MNSATRHLASASYLDPEFLRRAISQVLLRPDRPVAPSHGFDLVPVLSHARTAWSYALTRDIALLVVLGLLGLVSSPVFLALTVSAVAYYVVVRGAVVAREAWVIAAARRRERPYAELVFRASGIGFVAVAMFTVLGVYGTMAALPRLLGARPEQQRTPDPYDYPTTAPTPSDGADGAGIGVDWTTIVGALLVLLLVAVCVGHRLLAQAALEEIARGDIPRRRLPPRLQNVDREQSAGVVRYADFWPFVGAGNLVERWSLAMRITPERPDGPDVDPDNGMPRQRPRDISLAELEHFPAPFQAQELFDRLEQRLRRLSASDLHLTQRLDTVSTQGRTFVSARSHAVPMPPTTAESPEEQRAVRAWWLGADPRAVLLYPDGPARRHLVCQASSWDGELVVTFFLLVSVQAGMLHVEFTSLVLPPTYSEYHRIDRPNGLGVNGWVRAVVTGLLSAPIDVLLAPWRLAVSTYDAIRGTVAAEAAGRQRTDPGAGFSLREWASAPADNFYQYVDADKLSKLVERRVLAEVQDFLVECKVDVTELDDRAKYILNHTSVNNGVQTFGSSSARVSDSTFGSRNTSVRAGGKRP